MRRGTLDIIAGHAHTVTWKERSSTLRDRVRSQRDRSGRRMAGPTNDVLHGIIRSALDAGIDWIDTAEIYGDGTSEALSSGKRSSAGAMRSSSRRRSPRTRRQAAGGRAIGPRRFGLPAMPAFSACRPTGSISTSCIGGRSKARPSRSRRPGAPCPSSLTKARFATWASRTSSRSRSSGAWPFGTSTRSNRNSR